MSGIVDSRALRRYVARIDSIDGRVLGTGFFAAPGYVVTCAHVIRDATTVRVIPADQQVDAGDQEWLVAARSAPPGPGRGVLWPFPDLAVLRAVSEVNHPSALLQGRDPVGDIDCHAWGYARREEGVAPAGSPASFGFEGVEGDGFLRLKAGQAAPGLSGSPLVCPSRRAVVGVVTATRDPRSDLGGWAAPVGALLDGGEGVPDDLAEIGSLIRAENRAAALRSRREWNAVLPVDADGVLGQPWEAFTRGPRSTPAQLLRADHGVVRYLFRDAELDAGVAWCEEAGWDQTRMSIERVSAAGGAGKTRFAIELCRRLAALGWVAGMWDGDPAVQRVPLPRLVVVDYAEAVDAVALDAALDGLRRHADGMAPVRVLLLSRSRADRVQDTLDALEAAAPAALANVLADTRDNHAASVALSAQQRAELFVEAVSSFARSWNETEFSAHEASQISMPDLSPDRYSNGLLDVLSEALDQALGAEEGPTRVRPPSSVRSATRRSTGARPRQP